MAKHSINKRLTVEQAKKYLVPNRHTGTSPRMDLLEELGFPIHAKIEILEYNASNHHSPLSNVEGPLIRIYWEDLKEEHVNG